MAHAFVEIGAACFTCSRESTCFEQALEVRGSADADHRPGFTPISARAFGRAPMRRRCRRTSASDHRVMGLELVPGSSGRSQSSPRPAPPAAARRMQHLVLVPVPHDDRTARITDRQSGEFPRRGVIVSVPWTRRQPPGWVNAAPSPSTSATVIHQTTSSPASHRPAENFVPAIRNLWVTAASR